MSRIMVPVFVCGVSIASLALITGCPSHRSHSPPTPTPTPTPAVGESDAAPAAVDDAQPKVREVSLADVGLDSAALDQDVDPCDDFYQFACGGWLASHEIPADKARYGRISEVIERNEEALRAILEAARTAPAGDAVTAQLGAFYGACMDEAAVERAGLSGVRTLLDRASGVRSAADVLTAIAELHRHGIWAVFTAVAEPDFKDSKTTILFLDTSGLGLPDRDYYLKDEFAEQRAFYRGHVERTFALLGMGKAAARRAAADVVTIETELARVTKTNVQRRDVPGLYNKIDRAGLEKQAPRWRWADYFRALGEPDLTAISVTTPDYFARLDGLIGSVKPSVWGHYLMWQVAHVMADSLPAAHVAEAFTLTQRLTDQPALAPRWKRCVNATDEALGERLGQRYVAAKFAGSSKDAARAMVRDITSAFTAELAALPWMKEATKVAARAKLDKMSNLIGYPDKWKEYPFEIDAKVYATSVLRARAVEMRRGLAKAGKPTDRGEWLMTPQTVNAYYNPLVNQMVFPAGILQPPFFAAERSPVVNLGAIGMIVGHELTHGFDDSGALFNGDGNMANWWQVDDAKEFTRRGECLVAQYNTYEPIPGVKVNGALTLGENIADLGGVKMAFHAYRAVRGSSRERALAEGLTEDQQFFVAVGQAWCSKSREEEVRRRAVVDSHSPPRFRVNGVVRNLPEFAAAFSCQEGAAMRPASICTIW